MPDTSGEQLKKIGAAMAAPLSKPMDYSSIARRLIKVETLPPGITPVYDIETRVGRSIWERPFKYGPDILDNLAYVFNSDK
jgi:hypothetical protein